MPPRSAPTFTESSLRRARVGRAWTRPEPARPLLRTRFQTAELYAPKRACPRRFALHPRRLRAAAAKRNYLSGLRGLSYAGSARAGIWGWRGEKIQELGTHHNARAPSCVCSFGRRVAAWKLRFPPCLARPRRREEPLSFPWEPRPRGSQGLGSADRVAVAPLQVPSS